MFLEFSAEETSVSQKQIS